MKRKFFICLLIFVLMVSDVYAAGFRFIFSPKAINTFSADNTGFYCDTLGHWCDYAATRLHNEEIFTGMKIGNRYYFGPDEQVTRGEFLLYVSAVLQMESVGTAEMPFVDFHSIPVWQRATVSQMYKMGMVHGSYENGGLYFNCDESITRLEVAQILSNFLRLNTPPTSTTYTDSYLIPSYAVGGVKNATDYGLMKGYDDKSFRPYIRLNRAMLAEILCNLKDYCEVKNADKK